MNNFIKNNVNLNVSDVEIAKPFLKEEVITPPEENPLEAYKKEEKGYSVTEQNRILVFRYIETNQPTTRYQISKNTRLGYTAVRLIVRDLVFAGIVHEDERISKTNRTYKILTIPKEAEA